MKHRIDLKFCNICGVGDHSWRRKLKANVSLEKDRIKLKKDGRKIIIPLDQKEGKPWNESWDEDQEGWCLYQIKKNKDIM
jgi:hypothetical protein